MKTKFLRLTVLLLTLIVGIGQMWGTDRTFVSDQVIYFKDVATAYNWGGGSSYWGQYGGVYAYFFDAEEKNAWATASAFDGSAGEANRIYSITVPKLNGNSHTWTTVIFTRGSAASWDGKWQQTTNQTADVSYNLFYISTTKSGDNFTGSWGRYSPYGAVVGDANDWNPDSNPFSSGSSSTINVSIPYADYTFKVLYKEAYYGCNTSITNSISDWTFATDQGDCTLKPAVADAAKNYEFTWKSGTKKLSVSFPTSYTITYGVGTCKGSSSVTVSPNFTSGGLVEATTDVTFTKASTKNGYNWEGWWSNPGGTGTEHSSTDANLSWTATRTGNISVYACYSLITYDITYHLNSGSGASDRTYNVETATITLPTPTRTGYTFGGWYTNSSLTGAAVTSIPKGSYGDKEYWAKWTAKTYDVILDVNGATSGSNQTVVATYDAAMPTKQKTSGDAITAPSKTGYNFDGYTASDDGTGTKYYTSALASNHIWDIDNNEQHIYAKWVAKQSAITFDYQTGVTGYSSSGNITNATGLIGTYGSAMTALTGTMPSAINGYAFMGFYDATSGGTKYYNADGTSAHMWDKDTESGTTLYARWEVAQVTDISFSPGTVVENEATVTVTATVSPTPTGTTSVCWRVLYDNGSVLDPQPSFTPATALGNSVSFTAPNASGMYKIEAKLQTGSTCGSGTLLDTETADFQVAGSHTVTVAYKYSSTEIKTSTSVTGYPLAWSDPITAPSIFGYTFDHWTAGDGITLSEDGEDDLGDDESTSATIYIKATYNGTLTANYTPKNIVYFKDNLGWTDPEDENAHIYVNLLQTDYWDTDLGSGNFERPNRNLEMNRVPGTTDIFYYEYGNKTTSLYISFTKESMGNSGNFYQAAPDMAHVVFPSRALDVLGTDNKDGLGFYAATPMFVPLATQAPVKKNSDRAAYYNDGYWTKYLPGTGYSLDIYESNGSTHVKTISFTSADELMPMKVVTDLEGNHTYKFQLKRDGDVYYGNNGTMTYNDHGQNTAWDFFNNSPFNMCTIKTNAAGDYTFNLSYSPDNEGHHNRLRMSVDYPVADGDYRLIYTDDTRSSGTRFKPSAIVNKVNDGTDIVSFFVRKDENPKLYIQQATVNPSTGAITWSEYPNPAAQTNQITGTIESGITKDSVWNFNLSMDEDGDLSVTSVEGYSGNYYIRTDAANSKWDNYRTDPDHLMTYSDYLKSDVGYTHYYTHWVRYTDTGRKNVKFVIANDYSPCISDTLERETASGTWANIATFMEEGGDLKRSANVRFMWDIKTNNIARAYVDGAQEDGTHFLELLSADSKIKQGGVTKTEVTFSDNGNWLYEANVSALPNAQIKLRSTWGEGTTIVQYFKGASDATETLVGGSGDDEYAFRLIYDFKTNRLVTSYVPTDGSTISTDIQINADVMFIREHQGDIAQLTFTGSGAISKINTAYGVMQFNKWTINNKAKAEPHSPLSPELSRYERDLFYISFPFRVSLEEVFGFGTYGTHWIIEEYDGAGRAANGYWADSESYWKFITNRRGKFLEPNTGYILALDLDELGESSDVWANTDQVELYFPSYGEMPTITSSSVTYNIPTHTCNIGPRFEGGEDRRVKDSHWNVLSVPTYINTSNLTFASTDWITTADKTHVGPQFLYTWNMNDNTLTATNGVGYTYKAMHAYMVQYYGNVTWSTSVSPASIAARMTDTPDKEYKLELLSEDRMEDQTFVRMTDNENVSAGFEFNYDLSKEMNKNRANIYTLISTTIDSVPSITEAAANVQPHPLTTTIVPVGVKIAANGEYTFSMPEGTNGGDVWLIDNANSSRTNLGLMDYTVNLTVGTYEGRFLLEFPVQNVVTDIENAANANANANANADDAVRKVFVGGQLYIIRDGVIYNASGARVQ